VKGDFERAKADMEKDAKRAAKLEEKVKLLTGGFAARASKEGARAAAAHEAAAQAALTKCCYQVLQARERTAAAARVAALKAEVEEQREKEKTLQHKYEVLQQELAALRDSQAASAF
jgi:pre-mRNA-splicing factor CDC5/CEF1